MKKIIAFVIALMTIVAMAVPAYAVTPKLNFPSAPVVPKIKVTFTLPDDFWSNYFAEHPFKIS